MIFCVRKVFNPREENNEDGRERVEGEPRIIGRYMGRPGRCQEQIHKEQLQRPDLITRRNMSMENPLCGKLMEVERTHIPCRRVCHNL